MTVGLWEVPPLGWFIEVEILSETDDEKTVEAAKDQIVSFLNELGIPSEAHEPRYYMEMLLSQ